LPDRNKGSWVIWDKRVRADGEAINQAMSTSEFETCWSRKKHQRLVCRMVHSGICSIENDKRVHPTQKPVKLAEWFFERWGKETKLVVDLFLGSGSTLIACEKTGRKCYGMELDPHYCSVIIERWQNFTGKKAQRLDG
jgi:DNA modification methylase